MSDEDLPSRADLLDKLRILEAENFELTERSEELILLGALSDSQASPLEPERLIEQVVERLCLLRDYSAVAYGRLIAGELELAQVYSLLTRDTSLRVPLDGALEGQLREGLPRLLTGPNAAALSLRTSEGVTLAPHSVLVLPVRSSLAPEAVLVVLDTAPNSKLGAAVGALLRVADTLALRLENLALVRQLRELNAGLDGQIAERTRQLRELNASLSHEKARFQSLVQCAADAIFLVEESGRIVDVNERACESLGYSRGELIGRHILEIETQGTQEELRRRCAELCEGPSPSSALTIDGMHRRRDGSTFPVEIRVSALPAQGALPRVLISLARDVSERQALERQLLQAQKMESVGRLAGGVAHDFNNLLSTINGYCELLLMDLPQGAPGHEELSTILEAGHRAAGLTQQLLAFSRRQVLEFKSVNLAAVVTEASKMLTRLIGDDIRVELQLPEGPACVRADPVQVHQVLLNLAINARDAMPRGGLLRIEVCGCEAQEGAQSPRFCTLVVSDTGVGMTEEVRQHLFEPFFTTKEQGKGTGLGLATVYGILQQHGGQIGVHSEPGKGARFELKFPASDEPRARCNSPDVSAAGAHPGTERLLVVDDSDGVRRFLGDGLKRLGYRVTLAADGEEALQWLRANGGGVDLVLSDVVMPRLGGHELMARLATEFPRIPRVLMSGYLEDHPALRETLAQGTPLVRKPLSLVEVSRVLREALRATERPSSEVEP